MSKKVDKKQLRREAAAKEMARRRREAAPVCISNTSAAGWGASTVLSKTIEENAIRLGAILRIPDLSNATEMLLRGVVWPDTEFCGSTVLFRERMLHLGFDSYEGMPETELQDEMPYLFDGFKFIAADSPGSFWDGWESDFAGVDPATVHPFGFDGHYYFLITENPHDESDPMVYSVDHEEVDSEPYNEDGLTVGNVLAVLAPSTVKRQY